MTTQTSNPGKPSAAPRPTPPQPTPPPPDQAQSAGAGKGMPARSVRTDSASAGRAQSPHDAALEASLALPHERDQSSAMTPAQPDPVMTQARRDLGRGLKDTSKSPEMDRAYKKLK